MARAVVVLCDVHLENGKRVKAEELPPIAIEGRPPRVLALCARHKRDFYDPFVELVDDLALEPRDHGDGDGDVEPDAEPDQGEVESSGQDGASWREDPDQVVAESPAMAEVPDQPDTARWDCPVDDCDKNYVASGDERAEDLKRLGNLHLSRSHHLDKPARLELLSA